MRGTHWGSLAGVLLLSSLGITGCYDRAELEEQAFMVTMGIDQVKGGATEVYSRIAVPSKLSGSGGGGGGGGSGDFQSGTPTVNATGSTLHEALNLLNTGVERRLNLSHLSAIIFSEQAARKGLLPYLRTLTRYREFRRTLYIFVAHGKLADVFLKDKPVLETSATRLIEDLHQTTARTGFAPSVEMHQFLGGIESPQEDPVAPLLTVNDQAESQGKHSDPAGNSGKVSTQPGHIQREGGNPVECVGTALFHGDKMVGILDGNDTRVMRVLSGSLQRFTDNLPSPIGDHKPVTLGVRYAEPMRVTVDIHQDPPVVRVNQSFEAELLGDQTSTSFVPTNHRRSLEQAEALRIRSQEARLINMAFQKYRVDPFHFFDYAHAEFPTYRAMKAYQWGAKLTKLRVLIRTEVNLRRQGTQLGPPTQH